MLIIFHLKYVHERRGNQSTYALWAIFIQKKGEASVRVKLEGGKLLEHTAEHSSVYQCPL